MDLSMSACSGVFGIVFIPLALCESFGQLDNHHKA